MDAKTYFDQKSREWQAKSSGDSLDPVGLIGQRNSVALERLSTYSEPGRFLDVGCGTGQLVLAASEMGWRSTGIDFAPSMIDQCIENRQDAEAEFLVTSVMDYDPGPDSFDVVSLQGLIEYLTPEDTLGCFDRIASWLVPGGYIVVGSRNRLFNLVTNNDYTALEIELGAVETLAKESVALCGADSIESLPAPGPLPRPESHPKTGIDVEVRHQYAPSELSGMLRERGLDAMDIAGCNYHALPPSLAKAEMDTYVQMANWAFETRRRDLVTIPFCSTFVLTAQRRG